VSVVELFEFEEVELLDDEDASEEVVDAPVKA
jgi:hypothetical protein